MAVTEQLAEQRRRTEADQHTRESQRRERTHRSSHTHAMVGGSRLVCISTTRRVVDPRRTHRTPSSIIVIYSYFMTRPKEVERDVASHLKRASKVATGGMGALACCDLLIVVQALRKYSAALANRDST